MSDKQPSASPHNTDNSPILRSSRASASSSQSSPASASASASASTSAGHGSSPTQGWKLCVVESSGMKSWQLCPVQVSPTHFSRQAPTVTHDALNTPPSRPRTRLRSMPDPRPLPQSSEHDSLTAQPTIPPASITPRKASRKQAAASGSGGSSSGKKRARPPGPSVPVISGMCDQFVARLFIFQPGEDIASRITSLALEALQAFCIITATGAVSRVSLLRDYSTPYVAAIHDRRFQIVSLSGSYIVSETGGDRKISGGLSVQLADSTGRVLGGRIEGLLIAATEVQVLVGCFILGTPKKSTPTITDGGGGGSTKGGCSGGGPGSGSSHNLTHSETLISTLFGLM